VDHEEPWLPREAKGVMNSLPLILSASRGLDNHRKKNCAVDAVSKLEDPRPQKYVVEKKRNGSNLVLREIFGMCDVFLHVGISRAAQNEILGLAAVAKELTITCSA